MLRALLSPIYIRIIFKPLLLLFSCIGAPYVAVVKFNRSGGTFSKKGLHFFDEYTTHIQVIGLPLILRDICNG